MVIELLFTSYRFSILLVVRLDDDDDDRRPFQFHCARSSLLSTPIAGLVEVGLPLLDELKRGKEKAMR